MGFNLPSFVQEWPEYTICQGRTNPTFSKPCLCLSGAHHFRHFCCFQGSEERSHRFQWVECKFVIFSVFVKTALFGRGQKHSLPKTQFVPPRCKNKESSKNKKTFSQKSPLFVNFPSFFLPKKKKQNKQNIEKCPILQFGLTVQASTGVGSPKVW